MSEKKLDIYIQPTPNPNALKFILNTMVKMEGNSSYKSPQESEHIPLFKEIFALKGIDTLHVFKNSLTVSKFDYSPWDEIEPQIVAVLEQNISSHNPNYEDPNQEKERRKNLSPELQKIEAILDKTVRPGLQGDGGDLTCISFENNILLISYQGACGTCPSSSTGTLEAIRAILRDEYDVSIEVYIQPSENNYPF